MSQLHEAHKRSWSNSTRIQIPATPTPAAAVASSSVDGAKGKHRPFYHAKSKPSGRASLILANVRSFLRSRLKQLLPLFLLVLLYLFLFRGKSNSSSRKAGFNEKPKQNYQVDREALSKLAKLERFWARQEESSKLVANPQATRSSLEDLGDPDEARYINLQPNQRVPLVDHIPEPQKPVKVPNVPGPANPLAVVPAAELDEVLCPGQNSCQFLLPAFIGEQETKAQLHLYQMGLLAQALNRTLVLPNVIRSRMGSCFANPFSFYYSPTSLDELGIPSITQAQLLDWATKRDPPATAQIIAMAQHKPEYPTGAIEIDSTSEAMLIPGRLDRKLCLTPPKGWLNFTEYSPLAVFPPESWHKTELSRTTFGEGVVKTLTNAEVHLKSSRTLDKKATAEDVVLPNVLVFNYEVRFPILSVDSLQAMSSESGNEYLASVATDLKPFAHFPYSPTWIELASSIVTNLRPFIAIHWRQETLPTEALAPCADALLELLKDLAYEHPTITTVYLATDYPIEDLEAGRDGMVAHSGTFARLLTEDHHRTMRSFLGAFQNNKVSNLRLTTYEREHKAGNVFLPETAETGTHINLGELDSGLLGIVDKNIAMQAEVFVTGESGICGKESSFTRQIIADRTERLAQQQEEGYEGKGSLFEVVRHFTLPIEEVVEEQVTESQDEG